MRRYIIVLEVPGSSLVAKELEMFICFFCDERFSDKDRLVRHQDACNLRAFGLETLFKFKRLKLPQNLELQESENSRARQRSFLECFDIVSVGRAEALRKRHCNERTVCDVIVVEDSDSDDAEIELPTRPTYPRKLIPSDGRNFKRTSSFSPRTDRRNAVIVKSDNDVAAASHSAEKLLRIDMSSLLGQRLRDHVVMLNKSETHEDDSVRPIVVPNSVNIDSETSVRESLFGDRLRQRSDWQVTFRPSRHKGRSSSHSHAYRFSGRQRREFCRAFDRGLSVRARRLLQKMKPCRVLIPKLRPSVTSTYRSNTSESDSLSGRNGLILRIRKSVVSLTKCDYHVVNGLASDANQSDLNGSEGSDCQLVSDCQSSGLSSSYCSTQKPHTVHMTPDGSERLFDSEPFVTGTSAAAGENGIEASRRQSLRERSSLNAVDSVDTERSDLPSVSNDENADTASGHIVCVSADKENCPHMLDTTAASSIVVRNSPAVSARSAKTGVQTAEDCGTVDDGTDWVVETPSTSAVKRSEWSMSCDLPALSFLCNICGDVVDCERDARSLIYAHYAGHGITNIELMDERTPAGNTVIKLVELRASTTNSSRSRSPVPSSAADQSSPSKSILVRDRASASAVEFYACTASATHRQKKRRRVTWADEVLSQHVPSTVHSDAVLGSSNELLTSTPSQQTTIFHDDGIASTTYSTKSATILPQSVALPTTSRVVSCSMSSAVVLPVPGEYNTRSFPVISRRDTVSTTTRRPCLATAASRRRARLFWNSNLFGEGAIGDGDDWTTDECTPTPRRTCSAALPYRSKRTANGALL